MNPIRLRREWLEALTQGLTDSERRAYRMTNNVQVLMIGLVTLLGPNVLLVEPDETLRSSVANASVLLSALIIGWVLLAKRRGSWSAALTSLALNGNIAVVSASNGDDPAKLAFLITMVLPFLMFPAQEKVQRWSHALLGAALFIFFQYYYHVMGGSGVFGAPRWVVPGSFLMPPLVLITVFLVLVIYQFVKAVDVAEAKLSKEYEKSEKLLRNILPKEVADELKASGSSAPRHFDSATVCFTDFKGFTQIAEKMSPTELVRELDRSFSRFDALMDEHKLEKLKTIGDSYMFAGGIPSFNRTHAIDCVLAALQIQEAMCEMREAKQRAGEPCWELRVGIHTGPLVAGVIGDKKFAYDVWSDTVNTASRCESSGAAGRVNISTATHALIEAFFDCEYRGAIPAKNKGDLDMYFVNGLKPEFRSNGRAHRPNQAFRERYAVLASG